MRPKFEQRKLNRPTARSTAIRVVGMQLAIVCVLAMVALLFNTKIAWSLGLGGMAAVLPNLLLAYRFFRKVHQRKPTQILINFYTNSGMKILISVVIMVYAAARLDINLLALLLGYLAASIAYWLMPVFMIRSQGQHA